MNVKENKRVARHVRLRKKITGTSERPRLCVHRSLKNFSVQLVDDTTHKVLLGMSTMAPEVKAKAGYCGNVKAATMLGEIFATAAKKAGHARVCFDRGGYMYHGRVKAFADAARAAGMEF